jgi:hypothetical protein
MKYLRALLLIGVSGVAPPLLSSTAAHPAPTQRIAPLADGSARWASARARRPILAIARDARLYEIIGTSLWRDGRLPSDAGTWRLIAWSPRAKRRIEATVEFDGHVTVQTFAAQAPPLASPQPIPYGWRDSPEIFAAAAPQLPCGVHVAPVVELTGRTIIPGQRGDAWVLNFYNALPQVVGWDGTFVGTLGQARVPSVLGATGVATFPCGANLHSRFLGTSDCANYVMSGAAYDMDDSAWRLSNGDQNRDICAYKLFSALHMLGYQTQMGELASNNDPRVAYVPQVRALANFQRDHQLPVRSRLDRTALQTIDASLVARERLIGGLASSFVMFGRMRPLHPHDVSPDWVAFLFTLPMHALPPALQMSSWETIQCIHGQCQGSLVDQNGVPLSGTRATPSAAYFVTPRFDPNISISSTYSAATQVETVLHEFAHYLDGSFFPKALDLPLRGSIATQSFHDLSYDMSNAVSNCAPRRTSDPRDWISLYGFKDRTGCTGSQFSVMEEWAEAFSIYVTGGRTFPAAALQNATIKKKYDWLKTRVFGGVEYDTDLAQPYHTGCIDVPGAPSGQLPNYTKCDDNFVWDAQLRIK